MSGLEIRMIEAWRIAAEDLGILVTAPVELGDTNGKIIACEVLVHAFGSSAGAIALSERTARQVQGRIRETKSWYSILHESYYAYDRKLFIDTLDDWGWFGKEEEKPGWYTGRPWS
jgi:hypothetical protein